jgi:uncharacterized protein
MSSIKQETRRIVSPFEIRKSANGMRTIAGRGISYSVLSNDLGNFRERFAPGSVTVDPLFRCLYNHSTANLLGTLRAGTVTTEDRTDGLYYTCQLPDTTLGRDVQTLLERGDIGFDNSVSFGFFINSSNGEEGSDSRRSERVARSSRSVRRRGRPQATSAKHACLPGSPR